MITSEDIFASHRNPLILPQPTHAALQVKIDGHPFPLAFNRYIIQQRIKLPGACWTPDNVDSMLALRIIRANNKWDQYWINCVKLLEFKPHF